MACCEMPAAAILSWAKLQTRLAHIPDLREKRPPAAPRSVAAATSSSPFYFFFFAGGGATATKSARAALSISAWAAVRSMVGIPSPGCSP